MTYIKVRWKHSILEEPELVYSELDDERWETRKVEIFPDGRRGHADKTESAGSTRLGLAPIPELEEIARDEQFEPEEITKQEFEQV